MTMEFLQHFLQENLSKFLTQTVCSKILDYFQSKQFNHFISEQVEHFKRRITDKLLKFIQKKVTSVSLLLQGFSSQKTSSQKKSTTSRNFHSKVKNQSLNQKLSKKTHSHH